MRYFVFVFALLAATAFSQELSEFQKRILQHHNNYRAQFSANDTPQKTGMFCPYQNINNYADSTKVWAKPTTPLPTLEWSETAANMAQGWASQCKWQHNPNLVDAEGNVYGENVYGSSSEYDQYHWRAYSAVRSWYQELYLEGCSDPSNKNYQHTQCWRHIGQFQQVLHYQTTQVGCGYSNCPNGLEGWANGRLIIVCNYLQKIGEESQIYQ